MIPQLRAHQPPVLRFKPQPVATPIHAAPKLLHKNVNTLGHGSRIPSPEPATGIPVLPHNAAWVTGPGVGTHPITGARLAGAYDHTETAGEHAGIHVNVPKTSAAQPHQFLPKQGVVSNDPPQKIHPRTGKILAGQTPVAQAHEPAKSLQPTEPVPQHTAGVAAYVTNNPQNPIQLARPIANVKESTIKAPIIKVSGLITLQPSTHNVNTGSSLPAGSSVTKQPGSSVIGHNLPAGAFYTDLVYPVAAAVIGAGVLFALARYGKVL